MISTLKGWCGIKRRRCVDDHPLPFGEEDRRSNILNGNNSDGNNLPSKSIAPQQTNNTVILPPRLFQSTVSLPTTYITPIHNATTSLPASYFVPTKNYNENDNTTENNQNNYNDDIIEEDVDFGESNGGGGQQSQIEDDEQPPKKKIQRMGRRFYEIVDEELFKLFHGKWNVDGRSYDEQLQWLSLRLPTYYNNQAAFNEIMQHPEIQALSSSYYDEMPLEKRKSFWQIRVDAVLGYGGVNTKGSAARLADINKEGLHMVFGESTHQQLIDIRKMQREEDVPGKYGGWTTISSSPIAF